MSGFFIIRGVLIVIVEDKAVICALLKIDRTLRVNIILIILVLIQVIGGNVCYHGHIRVAEHGVKLKRAKLQHGKIIGLYFGDIAKERVADVPAEVDGIARMSEKLGDNGAGGGFAVTAGYGNGAAGAEGEEHFHFGSYNAPLFVRLFQVLIKRHEAGSAENDIMVKPLKVIIPKLELCPHVDKLQAFHAHFSKRALIARSYIYPTA